MEKEGLKYVLRQATERPLPPTHPRQLNLPLNPPKVVALTGIRRAGKTFLMFQTIRRLVDSGIDRRSILYLNLADDRLPRHERSARKQEQNPKKMYLVDPAITRAFATTGEGDRGAWLENLVFLHERRRSREIYYASNSHEIDLVVPSREGVRFLNVSWSLTDRETRDREMRAMTFGFERYPGAEGLLLAHETAGVPEALAAFRYLSRV